MDILKNEWFIRFICLCVGFLIRYIFVIVRKHILFKNYLRNPKDLTNYKYLFGKRK